MIVVDASAVIAMLFEEPQSSALAARLAADPDRAISVASYNRSRDRPGRSPPLGSASRS
jgi:uncharacterized protein with PIN domain